MKLRLILLIFFMTSLLLVFIAIQSNANTIYSAKIKKIKISQLQKSSAKGYARTRKVYVPKRTFILARQEIENILRKKPIEFNINNSSLENKATLIKLVKIINNVKEKVVLTVLAHTDAEGTAKHNLLLSQKRADRLKAYFTKRSELPLVVAIGYGETFALKHRLIEINLQRIKQ